MHFTLPRPLVLQKKQNWVSARKKHPRESNFQNDCSCSAYCPSQCKKKRKTEKGRNYGLGIASSISHFFTAIRVVSCVTLSCRVNWIYAITTFTNWKNDITKTELGETTTTSPHLTMPFWSFKKITVQKIHVFPIVLL
jgi:hypothetical protein